jgi:hypothetical protein
LEHPGQLLEVRKDLGLPLGALVEGLGCQADAIGLMPKLLGRLPSGFVIRRWASATSRRASACSRWASVLWWRD